MYHSVLLSYIDQSLFLITLLAGQNHAAIIYIVSIIITRSEARFARLLLDCELSYCFHWVIVVVGGRVHEWCKKGSGIL